MERLNTKWVRVLVFIVFLIAVANIPYGYMMTKELSFIRICKALLIGYLVYSLYRGAQETK